MRATDRSSRRSQAPLCKQRRRSRPGCGAQLAGIPPACGCSVRSLHPALPPSTRIPSWLEPAQLAYKNNVVAIAFSSKSEIVLAEIEIVLGEIEIVLAKFQIILISNFPLKQRKAPVPDPPGPPGPAPAPPSHPGRCCSRSSGRCCSRPSWPSWLLHLHPQTLLDSWLVSTTSAYTRSQPWRPHLPLWTLMDLLPLLHLQTSTCRLLLLSAENHNQMPLAFAQTVRPQ